MELNWGTEQKHCFSQSGTFEWEEDSHPMMRVNTNKMNVFLAFMTNTLIKRNNYKLEYFFSNKYNFFPGFQHYFLFFNFVALGRKTSLF